MVKPAIKIQEVIERLQKLESFDKTKSHEEADFLLCDALMLSGMSTVVAAYLAAKDRKPTTSRCPSQPS